VHLLQGFGRKCHAGSGTDDRINPAPRAYCRRANTLDLIHPFFDLGRAERFSTVKATAHIAFQYFVPMIA
jgi:hypothetical protein